MPLYFQMVRGEDAVNTGLLLAPQGIGTASLWPGRPRDGTLRRRRDRAVGG